MNNPHLEQAREWADMIQSASDNGHPIDKDCYAAAEVIETLPDQIVDGRRLRQILDFQGTSIADDARKDLESLLVPSLPTLHELARELEKDPEDYRWMQAKTFHTGELGCITDFDLYREVSTVLFPIGVMKNVPWEDITPLPDLPRLEWPAQAPRNPETPPEEMLNNTSSDTPRNPRPEEA